LSNRLATTEVKYQEKISGKFVDMDEDAVPTSAGTYKAILTVDTGLKGDSYQLSVEYTIEEAPEDIPDEKDDGTVKIATEKEKSNYASAGLASTVADVKKAVLTSSDQSEISAGSDINIWLELKNADSTVSAADIALTESAIPADYNLAGYFDITLWKQITGKNAVKVTNVPNGTVKVALTVPDAYQSTGRTYKIVRVHDGTATLLSTTLDSTTYKLTFETDKFSSYALIYTDTATDNQLTDSLNPSTTKKSTIKKLTTDVNSTTAASTDVKASVTTDATPETGDTLDFTLILLLMCVSLAGVFYSTRSLKK
jgi:hypothetical protein